MRRLQCLVLVCLLGLAVPGEKLERRLVQRQAVVLTGDRERLAEPARPSAQEPPVLEATPRPHEVEPPGLLERAAELAADLTYQVGALDGFCRAAGVRVRYVKLHGALYHRAARDRELAKALAYALRQLDSELVVLGPEGSALLQAAAETGLDVAREAFIDRAYLPDGQLVPRGEPGALLEDIEAIAERALRMVQDHYVVAIDGTRCIVRADSLCVHGDGPQPVAIVQAVRHRFESEGITLAPFVK